MELFRDCQCRIENSRVRCTHASSTASWRNNRDMGVGGEIPFFIFVGAAVIEEGADKTSNVRTREEGEKDRIT